MGQCSLGVSYIFCQINPRTGMIMNIVDLKQAMEVGQLSVLVSYLPVL